MGAEMIAYIKAVFIRIRNKFQRKKYTIVQSVKAAMAAYESTVLRDNMIHELVKSYEVLADKYNDGELAIRDLERQIRELKQEQRNIRSNAGERESGLIARIRALENPNE